MGLTAIWGTTEEKTSEVKVRSSETIQTKKKNVIVLELLWGRCPCCPPYPPPPPGASPYATEPGGSFSAGLCAAMPGTHPHGHEPAGPEGTSGQGPYTCE